jgi:hypothetical protein
MMRGTDLHVDVPGAGETVLFVPASFGDGMQDWVAQRHALFLKHKLKEHRE